MVVIPVGRIQKRAAKSGCLCKYDKPRHTKFFKRQAHKAVRRWRD